MRRGGGGGGGKYCSELQSSDAKPALGRSMGQILYREGGEGHVLLGGGGGGGQTTPPTSDPEDHAKCSLVPS